MRKIKMSVRVDDEKKSHEKKSDGVRVHHEFTIEWGESSQRDGRKRARKLGETSP